MENVLKILLQNLKATMCYITMQGFLGSVDSKLLKPWPLD